MVYLQSGETPDKIEHEAKLKRRAGRQGWEPPHAEDGHGGVRKEHEEHVARWLGEGGGEGSWEEMDDPPQGRAAATARRRGDEEDPGLFALLLLP